MASDDLKARLRALARNEHDDHSVADEAIAAIEELEAEIERRDSFAGCDGCSTGDCPHGSVQECSDAQAEIIREQAARIRELEAEVERLKGDLATEIEGKRSLLTMARSAIGDAADKLNAGALDDLVKAARQVEWGGTEQDEDGADVACCPWCGEPREMGHAPGCTLAAALAHFNKETP